MTVISIAVLIYAGFCAFMYASQRNAIYYPTPEVHVPEVEDMRLDSDGETLKIWRLAHADGPNAIIYFGGNAEDVSGNIPDFRNIFPRHNVYLVNYRGYGGSREQFEPGEALFVPAGDTHRFEDFSDDFAVWVVFYGPKGGE